MALGAEFLSALLIKFSFVSAFTAIFNSQELGERNKYKLVPDLVLGYVFGFFISLDSFFLVEGHHSLDVVAIRQEP